MNNLPALFLGIFFTLAFSWVGIVWTSEIQLGGLERVDAAGQVLSDEPVYPRPFTGLEKRGKQVYESLGCMYCHSQQVRPVGFGMDYERGWGDRGSVARDYIHQDRVLLGTSRTGPDLTNVGGRTQESWHHLHLYHPQITSGGSIMPAYPFLYRKQEIDPRRGPSPNALALPDSFRVEEGQPVRLTVTVPRRIVETVDGEPTVRYETEEREIRLPARFGVPPGWEVVPTERANALVAYMMSLNQDYEFPETLRELGVRQAREEATAGQPTAD